MKEEDEYLRKYKPEGEDAHYYECVSCGCGPDGSLVYSEFGLCLKCMEKYKKRIPRKIHAHVGRILLFGKKGIAEHIKKLTGSKFKIEGKEIGKQKPVYKEVYL